jgi:type IV pilus assembly protein PilY1
MSSAAARPFQYIVTVLWLVFLPVTAFAVATPVDVQVSAGSGDAEESELGVVGITEPVLDLGGPDRRVGLRFASVNVPRYASITNAYIQFTSAGADTAAVTFTIEAESSANAAAFTAAANDILLRPVFTETVSWTPTLWYLNYVHNTPDLKALVQKIVNSGGWEANNAMAFIFTGASEVFRRAHSFEGDPAKAPKLHIEWDGNAIEVRVNASYDDGYQYSTSSTYLTSTSVSLSSANSSYCSGMRFQNVNIPEGATISNAYIKVRAHSSAVAGSSTKTVTIWGEKRLSAPTFGTYTSTDAIGLRKGQNQTVQKAYWNNIPAWTAYQYYQTPDLKAIVQEIVGQTGWGASSKAMVFFMSSANESRSATAYNGGSAYAPLLHIDYLTPAGGGTGSPVMSVPAEYSSISRSVPQGETALARVFELLNTGSATLTYDVGVSYFAGAGWLSLAPGAASGSLAPGSSQAYTINFDSAGLAAGNYQARVTFTATNTPAPAPSSQSVEVYLTVDPPNQTQACDDVPVYLRETPSPAVMILLDLSQSMSEKIYRLPEGYQYPKTPDIRSVISEIVNYAGWQSGNALTLFLERTSGTGKRHCWAYDGYSGWAPLLHVEYNEPGNVLPRTLELRISQAKDDGATNNGTLWSTGWQTLEMGASGSGSGMAVRFPNVTIPYNATITKAYIEMVPTLTESGNLNLVIRGHQSANSPELTDLIPMNRPKTVASVNWTVEAWTGVTAMSKMEIAKQVIHSLVTNEPAISWGFGTWAQFAPYPEAIPAVVASEPERSYTIIHEGCAPFSPAHLSRLQAAISATTQQSGSDTPFAPSLLGAKKYFAGQKADQNGQTFSAAACQPKVLINVTDGRGNVPVDVTGDAYLSLVETRVGELLAAGVSIVGVGFGIGPEGDVRAQLQKTAELANAEGKKNTSDALFSLHAEDESGKGLPYYADDQAGLADALATIAGSIKNAVYYGSRPAAFHQTDLGNVALVTSYRTSDWSGDLQAITRDANGRWTQEAWRASEKVPAARKIYTVIDSGAVVPYTGYDFFCKPFGDVINSAPVVVGPPPFFYKIQLYPTFAREYAAREPMVYFGSNDGLIHAVRLSDGVEQWAFLPYSVNMKLMSSADPGIYDRCAPNYCHTYFIDAPPKVADVYEKFGWGNKHWRTVLVIGQGTGGGAYNALSVSAGKPFDDPDWNNRVYYLWEFTDAQLGETTSEPEIEVTTPPESHCFPWLYTWGVFFGSGYALDPAQQASKEAYLFGLKADDATPMWRSTLGAPMNKIQLLASGFRPNNAAGSPLVAYMKKADMNLCTSFPAIGPNRIYVGDLYGTIYRVTKIYQGGNPHQTRLFQFSPLPANPDSTPVRGKPTYAYTDANDHVRIYWGTGRYENEADKTANAQQYFFGVKDLINPPLGFNNVSPTYSLSNLTALQANMASVTINGASHVVRTISGSNTGGDSWYLKLHVPASGGSERAFTKPLAVGNVVFFTTFIPDADGCSGSGNTYLFALDYKTGLPPAHPVMDINGDNKVNDADKVTVSGVKVVPSGIFLGRGQGSSPVLYKNTLFVTTTVPQFGLSSADNANLGGLHSILVDLPNYKVRTESWKHNG